MAIQGSYKINYTSPKAGSFVIEPYTVNGTVTPTSDVLHSKATRAHTSLVLPGQYIPNYGEMVLEDLVHLLENFAGDTAPARPVEGQLWYDTGDSYDIVDLSSTGCTISGNHSAKFGEYIADSTPLTAWYGPVSPVDNSYNSIEFKVTSLLVDGDDNTIITVSAIDGTAIMFPNTAVGGFITLTSSSRLGRLKVAVKVNNTLTWSDVVNVNCSTSAPTPEHIQDGDLWYDLAINQLKINIAGDWQSLTAGYLPLSGGTMTGPVNMGSNPVIFGGTVSTSSTLTNKQYVDSAIEAAVAPLQSGTDASLATLTARVVVVETALPDKLSKINDNYRGALVFGPNGTTTTLSNGIDMNNRPLVNPSITWSSQDYLTAVGETHNVVDKNYVALALTQHLNDAIHGARTFIDEQPDGSGLINAPLFFADVSNTLTFNVNNTSYGFAVTSDSLVISTGSWIGSKITFRQAGNNTPLFELGDSAHRSYNSLYLFDGQPQPNFSGAPTDENEDTKVATKGYVAEAVTIAQNDALPITSASFTHVVETGPYELSLNRPGTTPVVVDINHGHMSDKIQHVYESMDGWTGGKKDLVGDALGFPTAISIDNMLNALNQYKAPTIGAVFYDAPAIGGSAMVTSIDDVTHKFQLQLTNATQTVDVGFELTMNWYVDVLDPDLGELVPVLNSQNYIVTSRESVVDPMGGPDTYWFTTNPEIMTGHDLVTQPITCLIPLMDNGSDVRSVMSAASLRKQIQTSMTSYVPDYVTSYVASHRTKSVTEDATNSFTILATHRNNYIRFTSATAVTVSVDPTAAWNLGDEVEFFQAGDGLVTLSTVGITANLPFGASSGDCKGKGSTVRLKNVGLNTWDVMGNLAGT